MGLSANERMLGRMLGHKYQTSMSVFCLEKDWKWDGFGTLVLETFEFHWSQTFTCIQGYFKIHQMHFFSSPHSTPSSDSDVINLPFKIHPGSNVSFHQRLHSSSNRRLRFLSHIPFLFPLFCLSYNPALVSDFFLVPITASSLLSSLVSSIPTFITFNTSSILSRAVYHHQPITPFPTPEIT